MTKKRKDKKTSHSYIGITPRSERQKHMIHWHTLNLCQFLCSLLTYFWLDVTLPAPSAPRNVAVTDKKPTSVKVTWLPPKFPNGIITKYRFLYSNNTGKNYTVEVAKGLKNASLFYVITGLKKDTDYLIYVSVLIWQLNQ